MRQTGRTTRIADFVIDQLHSVGRCICTDHFAFEYENMGQDDLKHLIELVERGIYLSTHGNKILNHQIVRVNGIYVIDFFTLDKIGK